MQDFIIPTERFEWGTKVKQGLDVRGLSVQDLTQLFTEHGKDADKILNFIDSAQTGKSDFDVKEFGAGLIIKAPLIVAHLIALATDMPDRATAARMPFPVQIRLLEIIYKMTIEETGGLNDFLDLLLRLLKSVKQATQMIPSVSSKQIDQIEKALKNTGSL